MQSIFVIFSIFLADFTSALPDNYCLFKLNTSDCNQKPTPVFTYYLPGSRCEIEFWRGCPTFNKFDDQYICSHSCIGRLFKNDSSEENEVIPEGPVDPCTETLNPPNCTKDLNVTVYTYDADNKTCVEAIWKGCDAKNKFDDEKSCLNECAKNVPFIDKLPLIKPEEADVINEILDEINEQEDPTTPVPEPPATEASTEAATTVEAAASEPTTPEPTTPETTEAPEGSAEEVVNAKKL